MRCCSLFFTILAGLSPWSAVVAQDTLDVCHAHSSYDLTVAPDALVFDRADAAPHEVRMHGGTLVVDGKAITLGPADQGRVQAFQRGVRDLIPEVRDLATQGVDLAAQAVREQARESAPQLAASGELDRRMDAEVAGFKSRIADSDSTHDWHGQAFRQYVGQRVAGIVPLLAGGMLQQSVGLAMSGDLDGVARLRGQAANLSAALQTRIRHKLTRLKPRIRALCPSVEALDRLEDGLDARMPDGSRLNLLTVGR